MSFPPPPKKVLAANIDETNAEQYNLLYKYASSIQTDRLLTLPEWLRANEPTGSYIGPPPTYQLKLDWSRGEQPARVLHRAMEICFGLPPMPGWEIWIRGDQLILLVGDFRKEYLRLKGLQEDVTDLDLWIHTLLEELKRIYTMPTPPVASTTASTATSLQSSLQPTETQRRRSNRSPSRPPGLNEPPIPRILPTETVGRPPTRKQKSKSPQPPPMSPVIPPHQTDHSQTLREESASVSPVRISSGLHPLLTRPYINPVTHPQTHLAIPIQDAFSKQGRSALPRASGSETDSADRRSTKAHRTLNAAQALLDAGEESDEVDQEREDAEGAEIDDGDVFDSQGQQVQDSDEDGEHDDETDGETEDEYMPGGVSEKKSGKQVMSAEYSDDDEDEVAPVTEKHKKKKSRKPPEVVLVEDSDESNDDHGSIFVPHGPGPTSLRRGQAAAAKDAKVKAKASAFQTARQVLHTTASSSKSHVSSARAQTVRSSTNASTKTSSAQTARSSTNGSTKTSSISSRSKTTDPVSNAFSAFKSTSATSSRSQSQTSLGKRKAVERQRGSVAKRARATQLSGLPLTPETSNRGPVGTPATTATAGTVTEGTDNDNDTPTQSQKKRGKVADIWAYYINQSVPGAVNMQWKCRHCGTVVRGQNTSNFHNHQRLSCTGLLEAHRRGAAGICCPVPNQSTIELTEVEPVLSIESHGFTITR
ncbi:hypothetical protein QFC22_006294 [Naganishia vaughanmartiniae]|uniref:Uncharacterized protein n=1 Tax=Naganishia vaughanmartiniae TaxID=1424756 RepID=A0ACC2WLM7_9TREE|nr:hypothetical protein QFC22_006294 [Naganishia vaughanmartiniae]